MSTANSILLHNDMPAPIYYKLKETIRQQVLNREFPLDSPIASEAQLMAKYNISRITVIRALSDLVHEGLLYRKQGKGTFISQSPLSIKSNEIVGLIAPMTGHVFESFSKAVIRGLTEHTCFCLMCDVAESNGKTTAKIQALIDRKPSVLVIDGTREFPYPILDKYNGRVVFMHRRETDIVHDADAVLSDYVEGGLLVGNHFLSMGFDGITVCTLESYTQHKTLNGIMEGLKGAFRNYLLPEQNIEITAGVSACCATVAEKVRRSKKPTAVLATADVHACQLGKELRGLNLRVPQDVALVGYYNTPWCDMMEPGLTSVSIREDVIARLVVEKIGGGAGAHETLFVKPELVVRDSCGFRKRIGKDA
jgi:GntR family transcriptional regulator, arabinose operon transcriptional repressor